MLVKEDEEESEDGGGAELEQTGEKHEVPSIQHMKLSLRSFVRLTSNKSFNVEGEIEGKRVVVLIDNGASGNFLDTLLARELNLKVRRIPTFIIEVGNGQKERGEGVCFGLQLVMQDVVITQNFFLMELGGLEVLGMDWLASLGKV